jgi:hypothetical protein
MGQSIATDADRATVSADRIESQIEGALDWLRPQLLELARAMQVEQLTPAVFFERSCRTT